MASDCIFCKIVRKAAPSSVVYEDSQVLAFLDIRPLSEGHTLVIPKTHYETVFDIPEKLLMEVHKSVKQVAFAVKETVKADGISIIQLNGKAAEQDVFHLHVHVVPRFEGKKLSRFTELALADRENLDEVAELIRKNFPVKL